MRVKIIILLLLVSSISFGQRDIHGKWKITRLYLGDSTRSLPGSKMLRYNPSTGEVSIADTTGGGNLTSTYIGYGNGSNLLTGTSDFIRNSSGEVLLNASDKGGYKFQVEGNMFLGNSTGAETSTPEIFNMGGTVGDDYTAASKLKIQLFNNGAGAISGIGVSNNSGQRVISYMSDGSGATHRFFNNGTNTVTFSSAGINLPLETAYYPLTLDATKHIVSNVKISAFHTDTSTELINSLATNLRVKKVADSLGALISGSPTKSKGLTIEFPTSAESIGMWKTPVDITVSSLEAVLVGSGSPSVTFNIAFGTDRTSGTNVFSSGRTVTSTTTGSTFNSSFNDATIPAGSFIWITTSAQSGTVTNIELTINYTED